MNAEHIKDAAAAIAILALIFFCAVVLPTTMRVTT